MVYTNYQPFERRCFGIYCAEKAFILITQSRIIKWSPCGIPQRVFAPTNRLKHLMIYWCHYFGFLSFLILFHLHTVFQTLDYTTHLDHVQLQISLAGSSPALFHNTCQTNINNSSRDLFFLLIEGLDLALWPLQMGRCTFSSNKTKLFETRIIY